ncbi:hypothetical protein AJ78_07707 [Emergomyces pasteurianus Ep9510]|uniref:Phospholipase/carboxylesterase/thioesterase domain-containing protein n=1 Tax=Emergomyces pasteurianus Ep9510 TaxID=1447872 RepID=A0A1J9PUJ2_9EURO|nr:hypothetical protein AJ78_07707 [Emergomyces pasteurianus Ep9510]
MPINQWIDNDSLEDPGQRTELGIEGLEEPSAMVRGLIEAEANGLSTLWGGDGYGRVVVGGLSQGCAAGVIMALGGGVLWGGWAGLWG